MGKKKKQYKKQNKNNSKILLSGSPSEAAYSPRPQDLSLCMIARDEEKNIGECLDSVKSFVDEIIVVDTGSRDRTVEIAKEYGAKVIETEWRNDFSYARNISLENAECGWILWLDADDRIPEESAESFKELKKQKRDRYFAFKVRNLKKVGLGEDFCQVRMFPNDPDFRFERPVHEQIQISLLRKGLLKINLPVIILHTGYQCKELNKEKAQRNREILLEDFKNNPDDLNYTAAIGDTYYITEDYSQAREWYNRAFNIPYARNKQGDIFKQMPVALAMCEIRLKNDDEAMKWVNRGLKLQNDKIDTLM
ncbi:MAG: glycosyltransferase family 2 protein, partial [bacterium]